MIGTTFWGPGQLPPGVLSWEGGREPPNEVKEEPTSVLPGAGSQKEQQVSPKACASSDCCNTGL